MSRLLAQLQSRSAASAMPIVGWLAVGGALAVSFVMLARRWRAQHELRPFAIGLVVAAGVYVVAAAIQGNGTGLLMEGVGAVAFGAVALAGLWRWPLALAAGWTLHVLWDVLLHVVVKQPYIGSWYPLLCISFDLTVAAYIAWWVARPRPLRCV